MLIYKQEFVCTCMIKLVYLLIERLVNAHKKVWYRERTASDKWLVNLNLVVNVTTCSWHCNARQKESFCFLIVFNSNLFVCVYVMMVFVTLSVGMLCLGFRACLMINSILFGWRWLIWFFTPRSKCGICVCVLICKSFDCDFKSYIMLKLKIVGKVIRYTFETVNFVTLKLISGNYLKVMVKFGRGISLTVLKFSDSVYDDWFFHCVCLCVY